MTPRSPVSTRLIFRHLRRRQPRDVEGADQIYRDHLAEQVERVRTVLGDVRIARPMPAQFTAI
jgi:hypothetical protein